MTESPTHTSHRLADEAVEYRSVPGRGGADPHRRIDISGNLAMRVTMTRLRDSFTQGVERYVLGVYYVTPGISLVWPVPREAEAEDILVTIENMEPMASARLPRYTGEVHIMDFWRMN